MYWNQLTFKFKRSVRDIKLQHEGRPNLLLHFVAIPHHRVIGQTWCKIKPRNMYFSNLAFFQDFSNRTLSWKLNLAMIANKVYFKHVAGCENFSTKLMKLFNIVESDNQVYLSVSLFSACLFICISGWLFVYRPLL